AREISRLCRVTQSSIAPHPKPQIKIRKRWKGDRVIPYCWQPPTLKPKFRQIRSWLVYWVQYSEAVASL
ncbi:hypothetical protein ON021_31680, partial [Microcoleus sp. HI-ES]|nr:hypothetical protein [Microcoleus sp. HI-ES]